MSITYEGKKPDYRIEMNEDETVVRVYRTDPSFPSEPLEISHYVVIEGAESLAQDIVRANRIKWFTRVKINAVAIGLGLFIYFIIVATSTPSGQSVITAGVIALSVSLSALLFDYAIQPLIFLEERRWLPRVTGIALPRSGSQNELLFKYLTPAERDALFAADAESPLVLQKTMRAVGNIIRARKHIKKNSENARTNANRREVDDEAYRLSQEIIGTYLTTPKPESEKP